LPTVIETKTVKLLAAVALGAIVLAGCSSGPTVTVGDGRGSAFCTDVAKFRDQANALEAAAGKDLASVRTQADATRDQLITLQTEANPADRVNGHLVKDDLQTAVDTYKALAGGLDSANASDPNAVSKVLASVQSSEGGPFTSASGRLDAYTKSACGVTVSAVTTTTVAPATTTSSGPTTTIAPVGPVVTSTTSTTSTTAAP